MSPRCRSTDTGSQGIIAGSSPIVIVGICTRVDRFDAVIVDSTAAGTATAAIVDQINHLFQLGHVDRIRVFFPGCHVGNLAGLLGIVDIFRPVPDIMVRRTHRNRCQSGIPHRIRAGIVGVVIAGWVISALIVGCPVRISLAAQCHGIMDIFFNPGGIADGCRSLAALFDGGIMPQGDGAAICRILSIGSPPHGNVIDRIRIGIGADGDGPDILHACGTIVVAGGGLGANGNTFSGSRSCLMADGNGPFTVVPVIPGVGFITQNDTILHMDGSFSTNSNRISCPVVIIPCRIDLIPDGNAAVMDGIAVQAQGQGILFHIVAVTNGDTVISVSIIRIGAANGVVSAQSQRIGPGHRVGIAEYRIIAALHGIIGPQYMGKIGFRRGAPVLLLAIHAVTIADSRAFICVGRIVDPQRRRIVSVGIVGMTDGRAGVLRLVVLADGYAHVVGHAVFSDGHAVFLGVGLVPNSYSGPAFSRHIAAQSHGIGGVDETGNHVVPVYKGPVRGIVSLSAASNVPIFIQPIAGRILVTGKFAISVYVVATDRIQDFGLVADGRGTVPFGHIVHAHCGSASGVIGLAGRILAVIGSHIVVDFHCLAVIFI